MSAPPEYLQPILFSIESAVKATSQEYPELTDKEVELTYDQFKDFFQKIAQGKELYEPTSTLTMRQALIEAILDAIDAREEIGADDYLVDNPDYQPGGRAIACLEALYATGFNYLRRSARFWRKERGPKGYLQFIEENVA